MNIRHLKQRSGFTLIEIIVVLLILGVLIAIAIPSLFGNIPSSRAAGAIAALHADANAIDACIENKKLSGKQGDCANLTFPPATKDGFKFEFSSPGGQAPVNGNNDWILAAHIDTNNPSSAQLFPGYNPANVFVAITSVSAASGQPASRACTTDHTSTAGGAKSFAGIC